MHKLHLIASLFITPCCLSVYDLISGKVFCISLLIFFFNIYKYIGRVVKQS